MNWTTAIRNYLVGLSDIPGDVKCLNCTTKYQERNMHVISTESRRLSFCSTKCLCDTFKYVDGLYRVMEPNPLCRKRPHLYAT